MPLRRFSRLQSREVYYFYDDFVGSNYESRWWAGRGSGGSLAAQASGLLRVRANANLDYELYQGDLPDLSVAALATVTMRAKASSTTSGRASLGLEAGASYSNLDWITIALDHMHGDSGAHWWAECGVGGSETLVDMGVVTDTNYHEFQIVCKTGAVSFAIDGVVGATITSGITTRLLQPTVRVASYTGATRDVLLDWVEVTGAREA